MLSRINFALLFIFAFACAAAVDAPTNRYGLEVVPDLASYQRLAAADPDKRLVDLETIDGVIVEMPYADSHNFMKRRLYPVEKAYLRAPAAAALKAVQEDLRSRGMGLKVWDAYRPYRVTVEMWEQVRNPDYVADPAKGSRHNRGAAVDVTLVDKNGNEMQMPTYYDNFSDKAHHDAPASRQATLARKTLREAMERHGFEALPTEWWHYDYRGWERFEVMDVPIEDLAR